MTRTTNCHGKYKVWQYNIKQTVMNTAFGTQQTEDNYCTYRKYIATLFTDDN